LNKAHNINPANNVRGRRTGGHIKKLLGTKDSFRLTAKRPQTNGTTLLEQNPTRRGKGTMTTKNCRFDGGKVPLCGKERMESGESSERFIEEGLPWLVFLGSSGRSRQGVGHGLERAAGSSERWCEKSGLQNLTIEIVISQASRDREVAKEIFPENCSLSTRTGKSSGKGGNETDVTEMRGSNQDHGRIQPCQIKGKKGAKWIIETRRREPKKRAGSRRSKEEKYIDKPRTKERGNN